MEYNCTICGGKADKSHDYGPHERFVGPKQETIKPYVRGLGTWRCNKCRTTVKVKRSK